MKLAYHPHDLLWVNALDDVALPEWFSDADLKVRPVVVRRALTSVDRIAVGIRGNNRSQRHASYIKASSVVGQLTPEQLVERQGWHQQNTLHPLPHWHTLAQIAQLMADLDLCWGITGSLAFELATSIPTANDNSDIDLRLLCPTPIEQGRCQHLAAQLGQLAQQADIQIETPNGAFAMNEWLSGQPTVLLKSDYGPYLTANPWHIEQP